MAAKVKGLDWNGDTIIKKMQAAARIGINRTMAVAVTEAKSTHPFENRTGNAERSIRIVVRAETTKKQTAGLWGSMSCKYFAFLEFGTATMSAFATLRPTAQRVYPILSDMIQKAYKELPRV